MSEGAPPRPPPAAKPKSARRRSREFALQGLYHWLLNRDEPGVVDAHVRDLPEFGKCDRAHYDTLLHGCIAEVAELDAALGRHVDRKLTELSPVEHAALFIGAYELRHCLDIPYKVVINEAVELAKLFGGTDGHKYVNGVLDKTALQWRAAEVAARREAPRGRGA